jgi:hypothetical protein
LAQKYDKSCILATFAASLPFAKHILLNFLNDYSAIDIFGAYTSPMRIT